MSKVQVDAGLLLALIRCYKLHHDPRFMDGEHRKHFIEAHRLECVAEGKVARDRKNKTGS